MRILCLTARLPYPPNRGDRLRAFNFIKSLSREHELHLVSFIADRSELAHIEPLKAYCREVHTVHISAPNSALSVGLSIWRPYPFQSLYYRSKPMQHLIDQVLDINNFDAVYIHLFRMAQFLTHRNDLYRIVDLTDVISREVIQSMPYRSPVWRLIYTFERPRIHRYERRVANTFEEIWLISEVDKQVLAADCPDANIQVVTNGIDLDRFYPTSQTPEPNTILFTGHMGVAHNVDAAALLAREVLPLVRQQVPDCTLKIVGAEPSLRVQRLAENPAVSVTGFVPDLNDYLNRASVFVAPLRFAAGIQNKVLEAMATARPVITTSLVNEGICAQPGRELLIADEVETTSNHIITLLADENLRANLGQAALKFVRHKFSWDLVLERINNIQTSLPLGSA